MGKVSKFSGTAMKKLGSKKSNKHLSSGGQSLAELVREATAKTLHRPDPELNQRVVDLIGSAVHSDGARNVAKVLTDRLEQKNCHKVWLAIMLIREVLQKAMKELGPAREDIMAEVEKVATAPMDRFDKNLKDQQSTKHAAYELLKMYGHDGHILSQPQQEREEADRRAQMDRMQAKQVAQENRKARPDILDQVKEEIGKLDNQNALLQDMLVDKTPFQAKSPQDQHLAKEILTDAQKMGQLFERLLGQLSSDERPEAQTLMQQALEKMDILNNSLALHRELIKSQAEQIAGKPYSEIKSPTKGNRDGRRKPASDEPSLIDFQDQPSGTPSTSQASHHQDPFAASTSWQGPRPSENSQLQRPPYNPMQYAQQQSQSPRTSQTQQRPPHNPQQYGQGTQRPPYNSQQYGQGGQESQSHQRPTYNPQFATQQAPPPGQANPYSQNQHPGFPGNQSFGQQASGNFGQGPLGQPGQNAYGQPPSQYPSFGYGYGGYGQQIPNYGQPYGHPPPNYGQPYGQPSSFGNPYGNQGQPQWNGQSSLDRPPQSGFGFNGSQNPSHHQNLVSNQAPSGHSNTGHQGKQDIPIITADIVINEPSQATMNQSNSAQTSTTKQVENVAASIPVTDVAKPKEVGFGESSFPSGNSAQASPVPPKTPANDGSVSRSISNPATTPDSLEKPAQSTNPTKADDFGFESSTFGGSSFSNPSDQPHTEKTAQKQTPSQSQGPPQVQSVFAGNPSHQEQPKTAPQPPSDWDLFFTERAVKPEGSQAAGLNSQMGNLSLNS